MESKSLQDILKVEGIDSKGFGKIPKVIMHDNELTLESKAIYAYLCSYTGRGETVFPSRDTILSHLKISKDRYYKNYKPLIKLGYIKVEKAPVMPFNNIYTIVSAPKKFTSCHPDFDQIHEYGIRSLGYGSIPKALMIDNRLNIKAKGIYAYLSSYAGNKPFAYPFLDNMLYHLKLSINTYYRYINELISCNYIKVEQQFKNGKFGGNKYFLVDNPDYEKGKKIIDDKKTKYKKKKESFHKNKDNGESSLNNTDKSKNDTLTPIHKNKDNENKDNENKDSNSNSINSNSINNKQSINQDIQKEIKDDGLNSLKDKFQLQELNKADTEIADKIINIMDQMINKPLITVGNIPVPQKTVRTNLDNINNLHILRLIEIYKAVVDNKAIRHLEGYMQSTIYNLSVAPNIAEKFSINNNSTSSNHDYDMDQLEQKIEALYYNNVFQQLDIG